MKKKIVMIIIILLAIVSIIYAVLLKKEEPQEEVNYYVEDEAIYEKTGYINETALENNIEKINAICEKYLNNMNIFFSIIPDKEHYLKDCISTDFSELENKVKSNLNEKVKYFNISDTLSLNDFYRTDMHWKQENLQDVVEKIEKEMNLNISKIDYEEESLGDFYGTYYKEIENSNIEPDELKYLNSSIVENCKVYNSETYKEERVYNLDKVNETRNKYDLFLSGASSIITIINENVKTDRKLILFRDSFGSSIAPLLVDDYKEIVLIDIRYVNYTILDNYIDFGKYKGADVLFLYSSRVINKSGIFR